MTRQVSLVFVQIELVLRRKKNKNNLIVETISRLSNFIAFNEKLENKIRPTEKKIKKKLIEMLK